MGKLTQLQVQLFLKRILGHEGGYWDDPVGGPTKWGISQRSYPKLDIASLTIEDASAIYICDFISKLGEMEDGIAYQLLDFGVNSGMGTAIRHLQRELGVFVDGVIGPQTQGALAGKLEYEMIMLIIAARLNWMAGCKNVKENCSGWMRRMAKNLRYGVIDSK